MQEFNVTYESICQDIIDFLCELDDISVDMETALLDDEILDSFTLLGLINLLEETLRFSVDIENIPIDDFVNVGAIATWAWAQK